MAADLAKKIINKQAKIISQRIFRPILDFLFLFSLFWCHFTRPTFCCHHTQQVRDNHCLVREWAFKFASLSFPFFWPPACRYTGEVCACILSFLLSFSSFFSFLYIASTVRCEWRGNNRFGREFLIVCPTFFPSILVSTGSSKLFCSKWKKTKNLFQVMCILYSRTMLEPCGNVLSWLLKFVPRFIKVRN